MSCESEKLASNKLATVAPGALEPISSLTVARVVLPFATGASLTAVIFTETFAGALFKLPSFTLKLKLSEPFSFAFET